MANHPGRTAAIEQQYMARLGLAGQPHRATAHGAFSVHVRKRLAVTTASYVPGEQPPHHPSTQHKAELSQ
eukprot:10561308-Alexandrium_andersonii.AAC.1